MISMYLNEIYFEISFSIYLGAVLNKISLKIKFIAVNMYISCTLYIKLIFLVIIITKYFIHCEQKFPLIQIRNETTRSQGIHFSAFKRVFVNSNEWIPEKQCSFNPRLVQN